MRSLGDDIVFPPNTESDLRTEEAMNSSDETPLRSGEATSSSIRNVR